MLKFLSIGIEPSSSLRKALEAQDLEWDTTANVPTRPRKNAPDVVLFAPKSAAQVKDLARIHSLFPKCATVLITRATQIEKLAQTLANEIYHDDVWPKEQWEALCVLSIPKWLKQQETAKEIEGLRGQIRHWKSESDSISKHSKKLLEQFERDVDLAVNIQRSLLPKATPTIPGISIATKYVPSRGMGGDYYDIFEFGDKKRFGILLADSKTHGMAAALLSVLVKLRLAEMKERFTDSKSFVDYLNKEIQTVHQKEMAQMSLLYGILDRSALTFQYTVAGNLVPLLWRLGESYPLEPQRNPPLGGMNKYEFSQNILTLKPSDLLIFHTDGLAAPLGAVPGTVREKLEDILKDKDPLPDVLDIQNEVMGTVDAYQESHDLEDDFTFIQFSLDDNLIYVASESK